ncbi:MAG: LacI family DNA-binding transcriptional regulator [Pseudomonadota bacterium]
MMIGRTKPATLKMIAERTGLSLSTVSLCLRGQGNKVRDETRQKVAHAAKALGYVPNRASVRLRTGRNYVLTLLLDVDANIVDYSRMLIEGVGAALEDTGYHLTVVPELAKADPLAEVEHIIKNATADGVILTHTHARDPRVQLLMEADFPFVCHGRTEFYTPHASYDFCAEDFAAIAVERLYARGRQHLLLAAIDNQTTNYALICSGFLAAIRQNAITGTILPDAARLQKPMRARILATSITDTPPLPDGIICNNELTALALIAGLQECGLILGRDYDLICKQTTDILPILHPEMDTIFEDWHASGVGLAKLLLRKINGEDPGDLQILQKPVPHWRNL